MKTSQLARVTIEDECTAIAGILRHGSVPAHLSPKCFPTPPARTLFDACLESRIAGSRDFGSTVRQMAEVIEREKLADGSAVLETVLEFTKLEASMRSDDLERNARHLARAAEYRRVSEELKVARDRSDHHLESVLAQKLAELETGESRDGEVVCVRADQLEEKPVDWLWRGYIPLGMLTLLASPPKVGKSTLTATIAARVSTGARWPSGPVLPGQAEEDAPCGDVLMITYEDDLERTVVPRLKAAGADLARVHFLRGIERKRGSRKSLHPIQLAEHFDEIERLVRVFDVRLVIVDPVMSGFGGERDTNADNEVRAVLGPFVPLAEQTRCAFLFVTHTNKRNAGPALDSAIGSRAFTGLCRSVIGLDKFLERKERRVLAPIGANLDKPRPGLVFEIKSPIGNEAHAVVEFCEEFDGDLDDFKRQMAAREKAMATELRKRLNEGSLERCTQAMLEIVQRETSIESKALDLELEAAGHAQRTIERARNNLKAQGILESWRRFDMGWTSLKGKSHSGSRYASAAQSDLEQRRARAVEE